MNFDLKGASKRQKLSLPFGGRQKGGARLSKRSVAEITGPELRKLVASMID